MGIFSAVAVPQENQWGYRNRANTLAAEIGTDVGISVMSQYVPAHRARDREPWNRGITRGEYEKVALAVDELGFETGWMQGFGGQVPKKLLEFEMQPGGEG